MMTIAQQNGVDFLVLPNRTACFAVAAGGKGRNTVELHGGFADHDKAASYRDELKKEYEGYDFVEVIEIELEGLT